MFRFLFGVAFASAGFYIYSNHPEWIEQTTDVAREQFHVAVSNLSESATGRSDRSEDGDDAGTRSGRSRRFAPEDRPTTIDFDHVSRLTPEMKRLSSDELWVVLGEDDYDRRAAAARVLLGRANIPANEDGVEVVRRDYFRSRRADDITAGFSYLGLLALQDVSAPAVERLVRSYVERHPQERACDNALWALGQTGSADAVPYFFEVISDESKYGPAARERAFCCLVQCGRYSPAQRFEMIPKFIELAEASRDRQTRTWATQALVRCAPGARCTSLSDWKNWWAAK